MTLTLDQLSVWMATKEDEHLEFKEAKKRYDFEELVKYCVALANEGGGTFILGVTDKRPRMAVGSSAFSDLERTKASLVERLHLRVDAETIQHPDGRVVVFQIPSRPIGMPINHSGAYWMRSGQDLVPMTQDMLRRILDEAGPDFSAETCPGATVSDLDPAAIQAFRRMWARKSGNERLRQISDEQLLYDAELIVDGGVTYAALVLLGTHQGLGKHLAQSEIIFEYRSSESTVSFQQRREFRQGFIGIYDDLWDTINLRNEVHQYHEGLFVLDIPVFNEAVIREALLNAISHRDYRLGGSTFVRQFPHGLELVSPGSFPPGVTPENILWRQSPRNRRLAEAFQRCGLVERSGQGANRMFEECIKESKPRPDFTGSDEYQVSLTLRGDVQDSRFLAFLEMIGRETLATFATDDFLVLDLLHREQPIPKSLKNRLPSLKTRGVIETRGSGRGTRYLLSRQLYTFLGKGGVYTGKRGLDRETNKALLMKHISDNRREGSQLGELAQVLPELSRGQIQLLLRELKNEGRVLSQGRTRSGRWYPGSCGSADTKNG